MNPQIEKLNSIAAKSERKILGLMSGTSLDGLDIALCQISDSGWQSKVNVLHFDTIQYDAVFRDELFKICSAKKWDPAALTLMHAALGRKFALAVNDFLQTRGITKNDIDLIASHGQTVYHVSSHLSNRATLQLGDGDHIATDTGIITISDLRQKNVAAGGEGAPLAPYVDLLLFAEEQSDVILINIGGIANFSFIPARKNQEPILCSDIGPGNALMDACTRKYFNKKNFDEGGKFAAQGKVIPRLLDTLMNHTFFRKPIPKTTGTELFNAEYLDNSLRLSQINEPARVDIMATVNFFTAKTIASTIKPLIRDGYNTKLFISGGGANNPVLMANIKNQLINEKINFHSTEEKGIHPDAKEAVLFALLANECVAGNSKIFEGNGAFMPAVSMGKISLPG